MHLLFKYISLRIANNYCFGLHITTNNVGLHITTHNVNIKTKLSLTFYEIEHWIYCVIPFLYGLSLVMELFGKRFGYTLLKL